MKFFNLIIFFIIHLSYSLLLPAFLFADRTIIDLDLNLNNIASRNEAHSESMGEGFAMRTGEMTVSSSSQGVDIQSEDFPVYAAHKKFNELKSKTTPGRSVIISYKLTNYQFSEDNRNSCTYKDPSKPEEDIRIPANCFNLLYIGWIAYRIDFRYKVDEKKWETGSSIPNTFFFDTPTPATVVGIGDLGVHISGVTLPIKPDFSLWNIHELYKSDLFKIVVSKVIIPKHFVLIEKEDLETRGINTTAKYQITGKANVGDSAIRTERSSFWYPFDKYVLWFIFKAFYDARLNITISDIEDLDLQTKDSFSLKLDKDKMEPFKIVLYRDNKLQRFFWPILAAIFPLITFLKPMKEKSWYRYSSYFITLAALVYLSVTIQRNHKKSKNIEEKA